MLLLYFTLLAHGRWLSPASPTTKTGHHDIAKILLKVAPKINEINENYFTTLNCSFKQLYFQISTCQFLILTDMISHIIMMLGVMVFNATFNNISVISWMSVLLLEESGIPGENHKPAASH
jgi:hypothetical protein